MPFQLMSKAFKLGERIPEKFTCDSDDVSPPLAWTDPPAGTITLALINDDPDCSPTWSHWVIYNIPPTARALSENIPKKPELPDGTMQGTNDFKKVGYGGPCPPKGVHRYSFRLYALDHVVTLPPKATQGKIESAMKGHILGEAQLIGTYQRR